MAGRKNAGLAVIGIANTLDLPERLDPKVRSRLGSRRLTFATYKPAQIESILTQRLGRRPERGVPAAGRDDGGAQDRGLLGRRPEGAVHLRAGHGVARSGRHGAAGGRRSYEEAQYVVTIADINAAYRLLSDSSYLGAIEHAAPLEQLVLIALCAELRARKSETAPLEDVARRLARLVASRATRATPRARRRTARL